MKDPLYKPPERPRNSLAVNLAVLLGLSCTLVTLYRMPKPVARPAPEIQRVSNRSQLLFKVVGYCRIGDSYESVHTLLKGAKVEKSHRFLKARWGNEDSLSLEFSRDQKLEYAAERVAVRDATGSLTGYSFRVINWCEPNMREMASNVEAHAGKPVTTKSEFVGASANGIQANSDDE